jgi:hypothetical protein
VALKDRLRRLERRPELSPKPNSVDRIREIVRLHVNDQDTEGLEKDIKHLLAGDSA